MIQIVFIGKAGKTNLVGTGLPLCGCKYTAFTPFPEREV